MSLKDKNDKKPMINCNTTSSSCKHYTKTKTPISTTSIEPFNTTSRHPNSKAFSHPIEITNGDNKEIVCNTKYDDINNNNGDLNSISNYISNMNGNDENAKGNKDNPNIKSNSVQNIFDIFINNAISPLNSSSTPDHQKTISSVFKSTSSTSTTHRHSTPMSQSSSITSTDTTYNQKTNMIHNQHKTEITYNRYKTETPQNETKPEAPSDPHSPPIIKSQSTLMDTQTRHHKPSITKSPSALSKTGKSKDHPWNRSLSERVRNIGALKRGLKKEKNYKAKEYDVIMTYYWLINAGYPIFVFLHQESHMAQEAQVKGLVEADGFGAQVANSVWRKVNKLNRLLRVNIQLETLQYLRFDDLLFSYHPTLLPQFIDDVTHNNYHENTSSKPTSTTTSTTTNNHGDLSRGKTRHSKTHVKSFKLKRNKRLESVSINSTPQHSKNFKGIFFSNSLNLSSLKLTFSFLSLSNGSPISGAKLKKMKKSGIKKLFRRLSGSRKYKMSTENLGGKKNESTTTDSNENNIKSKNYNDTNKSKVNDATPNDGLGGIDTDGDTDFNNNKEVKESNEFTGVNKNSNRFENFTKNNPWLKSHSDFLVYYTYMKKDTLSINPQLKTKIKICSSIHDDDLTDEKANKNKSSSHENVDRKPHETNTEKAYYENELNDKRFCYNDRNTLNSICYCGDNKNLKNNQENTKNQEPQRKYHGNSTSTTTNHPKSTQLSEENSPFKTTKKSCNDCRKEELDGMYADLYHQINSLSYNSLASGSDNDFRDRGEAKCISSKVLVDKGNDIQKDSTINCCNKNSNINNNNNNKNFYNNNNNNNNNNKNNNNNSNNTEGIKNSYRSIETGDIQLLQKLSFLRLATLLDIEDSAMNELLLYRPKCAQDPTNNIFGLRPQETLRRHGQPLPTCIARAMWWLGHEAKHCIGVFRKPGVKKRTLLMQKKIEENPEEFDFYDSSPYDVADLLKTYFRLLPESLFPPPFTKLLLLHFPITSSQKSLIVLQHIVTLLPCEHRDLLSILIKFLKEVASHCATNNMNNQSLAVCFAPSLFHENVTFSSPKTYNKKSMPKNSSKTTFTESLNSSLNQSQNSAKTSNQSAVLQTNNTNIIGQLSQPFFSFHHSINFHDASVPSYPQTKQKSDIVRKSSRSHSQTSADDCTKNLPLASKRSSNNNESLNDLKSNEVPLHNSTTVSSSFLNQSFCKSPRTKASSRFKYFFKSKSNDNITKDFSENDEHIQHNKVATQILNTLICHYPSIFHVSNDVNCKDFSFLEKRNKNQRKKSTEESRHNEIEEKTEKIFFKNISSVLEKLLMDIEDETKEYKEYQTTNSKNIQIYHTTNTLPNSLKEPISTAESTPQSYKKSQKTTPNSPKKFSQYISLMQQNSFSLATWLGVTEVSDMDSEDVIEAVADQRGDWDEDLTSWEVLQPLESISHKDTEFLSKNDHKDFMKTKLNGFCGSLKGFQKECSTSIKSLLKNLHTAKTDHVKYSVAFSPLPDLNFNVKRARLSSQDNNVSCLLSFNESQKSTDDTNVILDLHMAVALGASLTRLYHFSKVDLKGHGVRWYEGVYGSLVERDMRKIKEAFESQTA